MAFRLAVPSKAQTPVDPGRVADWFLNNLDEFAREKSSGVIELPAVFLSALAARLGERFESVESALRGAGTQWGGMAALASSVDRLAETFAKRPEKKVESPYFTKEEAAVYMRTTVDGIYGRVERGQLESCPGVRELIFTREMLDDSMMGRVQKRPPRRPK